MTIVVNKRHGDPFYVYIGRPGPFGNPVELGKTCSVCGAVHTRAEGVQALICSARVLIDRLGKDIAFRALVQGLEGKALGCYCKPAHCHGDLYVDYLEAFGERLAIMGITDRDITPDNEQLAIAHRAGMDALPGAIEWYRAKLPPPPVQPCIPGL